MATDSESSTEPAKIIDGPFDAEKATNTEIQTFIKDWMTSAEEAKIWNNNLWYLLHEDFAKFTVANFKELPKFTRMMLRTFLYTRGAHVSPYNTTGTIGDALYECARRETPHKWTWEDIQNFKDQLAIAVSPWLAKQVNNLTHRPTQSYNLRQVSPTAPSYAYSTPSDLTNRPKAPVLPASTFASPLLPISPSQNQASPIPKEYYPQGSTNIAYSLPIQQTYHLPLAHIPNEPS